MILFRRNDESARSQCGNNLDNRQLVINEAQRREPWQKQGSGWTRHENFISRRCDN